MANINLLPWREWERERKKKEFLGNLAGVFVLGAVLVVAGIALGVLTTRRLKTLHDEVTTRGRKTDAIEWSDARVAVEKGRVAVRVSGNCILCQAPRAAAGDVSSSEFSAGGWNRHVRTRCCAALQHGH